MKRILVIHGPGHDKMGKDANNVHPVTMEALNAQMEATAQKLGIGVSFYQNNDYKAVTGQIAAAKAEGFTGLVFNPGAWMEKETEGGALAGALRESGLPVLEIHMTNICKADRVYNAVAPSVTGLITGFGEGVYSAALEIFVKYL